MLISTVNFVWMGYICAYIKYLPSYLLTLKIGIKKIKGKRKKKIVAFLYIIMIVHRHTLN